MVTEVAELSELHAWEYFPSRRTHLAQGGNTLPDTVATLYVALTVVIMAYSSLFNVIPILVFLLLWLRHVIYRGRFTLRPSPMLFAALAFPLLCCYSAFWSDYPGQSIYHGFELLSLAICAVIMARLVKLTPFLRGCSIGVLIVLAITLANGQYSKDLMSGTYSLVGLFDSKNQVGFVAEIGIFVTFLGLFSRGSPFAKIFYFVPSMVISFVCLARSSSATSVASLAILAALFFVVFGVTRFRRQYRGAILTGSIAGLATVLAVVAAARLDLTAAVLEFFGKSSTLTGRTYLWSEGLKNGLLHPVLGCGYSAFWVPGQVKAEEYWHKFYITSESGFHFHNLFVQTFVDLGAVGVVLISCLLLYLWVKSLRAVLRDGLTQEAVLAFGLASMFLIRAGFEVDVLGPYGLGPLLFFSLLPMQEARQAQEGQFAGGNEAYAESV